MLYKLKFQSNCFHRPTQNWHCHEVTHNVAAVSRKHALNKALELLPRLIISHADRETHPDWQCEREVTILD
jgi:hypothetical protein